MAYDDKSAFALCVFSFAAGPDSEPITFSGKTPVCLFPFIITTYDVEERERKNCRNYISQNGVCVSVTI